MTGGLGVASLSDAGVGEFSQKEPRENKCLSSDSRYVHFIGKKNLHQNILANCKKYT